MHRLGIKTVVSSDLNMQTEFGLFVLNLSVLVSLIISLESHSITAPDEPLRMTLGRDSGVLP